ncbi:hypothetical protein [Streptacidiphilus sp. EB103A]|uniref:hypothetical protein n=1 Tax=Streptacidiphilus sp. EB103A TaxID=3156275 RepID=UPI0035136D66
MIASWRNQWADRFQEIIYGGAPGHRTAAGPVRNVQVGPGFARAAFLWSQTAHEIEITMACLQAADEERFARALAASPASTPWLAGTVTAQVLAPDAVGGVRLLPRPEEVTASCSCSPDCAYRFALLLRIAQDSVLNPALMFELRGLSLPRIKRRVAELVCAEEIPALPAPVHPLAPLPADSTAGPSGTAPAPSLPIPRARQARAVAVSVAVPQLLHDQPLPAVPGQLPPLATLRALAHAGARRARSCLEGIPPEEDPLVNAVHLAATAHSDLVLVAHHLGTDPDYLRFLATTHRRGGCAAVAATHCRGPAESALVARAGFLIDAGAPAGAHRLQRDADRLTDVAGGIQVRLARDHRWYAFRRDRLRRWSYVAGGSTDPLEMYLAASTCDPRWAAW